MQFQESMSNLQPTSAAVAAGQRYPTDSNILMSLDRWHSLLAYVPGFDKVQYFGNNSQKAIPPRRKGKETAKKYTLENVRSPEGFLTGCSSEDTRPLLGVKSPSRQSGRLCTGI
jgi:hypothetical protein